MRRDITPADEAARLVHLRDSYGFDAFKWRVGAECGHDVDEWPGRTEAVVPEVARALGAGVAKLVDANSGFSPRRAIEVGRLLEAEGVGHYEEPCPYWKLEETKQVADALDLDVTGGEQDWDFATWARMIEMRAVDVVQPDVMYMGGIARTLRVAQMAARAGLPCTPHSANLSLVTLCTMHLLGALPNAGKYLELSIEGRDYYPWQEGLFVNDPYRVDGRPRHHPVRARLGRRGQPAVAGAGRISAQQPVALTFVSTTAPAPPARAAEGALRYAATRGAHRRTGPRDCRGARADATSRSACSTTTASCAANTSTAPSSSSALDKGLGFCDVVLGWDSNDQLYDNVSFTGWHTAYPDAPVRLLPETCRALPLEGNMLLFLGEFAGKAEAVCPRATLRRVLQARRRPWAIAASAAAEYEFFVFERDARRACARRATATSPTSRPGFFGYSVLRSARACRALPARCCSCAEDMRMPIEGLHTETGPGVLEAALALLTRRSRRPIAPRSSRPSPRCWRSAAA